MKSLINKIKTWWSRLTVNTVNKTFGVVVFVLVFLFTFLFGFQFKDDWKLLAIIFGSLVGVVAIAWVLIVLIINKRNKSNDINKQKIDQAIKKLEEENKNKPIEGINNN